MGFSMKNETKEKNMIRTKPNKIFLVLLLIVAAWFYWFQYRQVLIRKDCYEIANTAIVGVRDNLLSKLYPVSPDAKVSKKEQNNIYRACLAEQGLKPESLFVNLE